MPHPNTKNTPRPRTHTAKKTKTTPSETKTEDEPVTAYPNFCSKFERKSTKKHPLRIPPLPHARDAQGNTPLHRKILEIPHQPLPPQEYSQGQLDTPNFCQQTPVHYAAMAGCLDLLPPLDAEAYSREDIWGNTPIHLAGQHGNLHQVPRKFLTYKALLRPNTRGLSALLLAAEKGHLHQIPPKVRTIKTLLKKHPQGRTALHEAFFAGDFTTLPPELLKPPSRGTPDHNQITPLHRAAEGGHLETLHHLEPLQLQELLRPDSHGETPLHLAPLTTIPKEFLNDTTLTLKTPLGQTPLHKAAEDGLLLTKIPHPATHLLELLGEDQIALKELLGDSH